MKRFKSILAVYNQLPGDETTLKRATALARRNSARLTVVEANEDFDGTERMTPILSEAANRVAAERQVHLERLIGSIRRQGVEVSAAVLSGSPFLAIIRAVLREKHDLVMITAEAQGSFKRVLFGSTSMHLMRKCPCPVWITDPDQQRDSYSRILAAVDTSTPGETNRALNMLIMDLSTSLARREQSEWHVVHASEANRHYGQIGRSEMTRAGKGRQARIDEGAPRDRVDELLDGYDLTDLSYRVHVVQGRARSVIPRVAAELQTDLLVMGTVSRTGIAGLFIGNTAETVLRQVECSVLTVKPAGFDTPVTL